MRGRAPWRGGAPATARDLFAGLFPLLQALLGEHDLSLTEDERHHVDELLTLTAQRLVPAFAERDAEGVALAARELLRHAYAESDHPAIGEALAALEDAARALRGGAP